MPKVISFINRKGGVGKTTSAIQVAINLKQMKFDTALIETDSNYTLGQLRELELGEDDGDEPGTGRSAVPAQGFPAIVQTDQAGAGRMIQKLPQEPGFEHVDMIIVDGAANMSAPAARDVAARSDIVIIPTSLTTNDLAVTERTLSDLQPVMQARPELKVILLATRIHFRTAPETIAEKLAPLGVPLLDIYVPDFKMYKLLSTVTPVGTYRKITQRILKLLTAKDVRREMRDVRLEI